MDNRVPPTWKNTRILSKIYLILHKMHITCLSFNGNLYQCYVPFQWICDPVTKFFTECLFCTNITHQHDMFATCLEVYFSNTDQYCMNTILSSMSFFSLQLGSLKSFEATLSLHQSNFPLTISNRHRLLEDSKSIRSKQYPNEKRLTERTVLHIDTHLR